MSVRCAIWRKYKGIFVQCDETETLKIFESFENFRENLETIWLIVRQLKCKFFVNFLRYPLTSQNFFLNQKNPHRAIFRVHINCVTIRYTSKGEIPIISAISD